jgi:hypothetical protein
VIRVEAVDELFPVNVALVLRAAVPEMGVTVDDEYFFALRRLEHELSPAASRREG